MSSTAILASSIADGSCASGCDPIVSAVTVFNGFLGFGFWLLIPAEKA
jgi:hypothetical protein